jgi:hypothetical protein
VLQRRHVVGADVVAALDAEAGRCRSARDRAGGLEQRDRMASGRERAGGCGPAIPEPTTATCIVLILLIGGRR